LAYLLTYAASIITSKYDSHMDHELEIIIPVHNISERHENLCKILSAALQPRINYIIVSDSKSEVDHDQVRSIVLNSPNPHSKVISGSFGNPGLARNAGLAKATADWVSFLDSDDEVDLSRMSTLITNAVENSAEVAIGGICLRYLDYSVNQKLFLNSKIPLCSNISINPAFTRMIFARKLISQILFPSLRMAEDQCFVLRVFSLRPVIYAEEIYFYTYNIGGASQTIHSFRALKDLPIAIQFIQSLIKNGDSAMLQMYITTIVRLSATYAKHIREFPFRSTAQVFRLLAKTFCRYPLYFLISIQAIFLYRQRFKS
jgi:glycosyltransferase involved in cell wall biosynthesis